MLEEILQTHLSDIAETFKDEIPKDNSVIPVIRYCLMPTTEYHRGDDRYYGKVREAQIDLFTHKKRFDLEEEIDSFLIENHIFLKSEDEKKEESLTRKIYFIKYEE